MLPVHVLMEDRVMIKLWDNVLDSLFPWLLRITASIAIIALPIVIGFATYELITR